MKMTLLLFLLCSGFFHFTFASNRLRLFHFPRTEEGGWNDMLATCNQTNETFVTLYDEDDVTFIDKFVNGIKNNIENGVWLGLRRDRKNTWSNGDHITFNNTSQDVTRWEQLCEAIDNNSNTWTGFNCSERKPFMCHNGTNYILIENEMTWCQALQYCRKSFIDLVSISSEDQNMAVIKEGKNKSFWIGLLRDEWEWEDKSCSSFRIWGNTEETDRDLHECTYLNMLNSKSMKPYGCDNAIYSLCSKGTVRIKLIKFHLTWEQAFDYCAANHTRLLWIEDEEDQGAVKQWLNHTTVNGSYWIGLRQSRVFGFWIWTSDRTVSYTNWKNDMQPEMPLSNNCGVINRDDYKWSDENCWYQLPFLCEEDIVFMNK